MRVFQSHFRGDRRAKPGAIAVATLVCLALLALLTVFQVVHVHPDASDADHCQLCITMHSAAPAVVAAVVATLVQIQTLAPVVGMRAVIRNWHPKLFTRPPPTAC